MSQRTIVGDQIKGSDYFITQKMIVIMVRQYQISYICQIITIWAQALI